jgi:hypothetical protein
LGFVDGFSVNGHPGKVLQKFFKFPILLQYGMGHWINTGEDIIVST